MTDLTGTYAAWLTPYQNQLQQARQMDSQQLQHALLETMSHGGYTHWNDGEVRVHGYCVGNNSTSMVLDLGTSEYAVLQVLNDVANINRWMTQYGASADGVGFWVDEENNRLYIDAVTYFTHNQLPGALDLAITNNELAVYDILSSDCIDITPQAMNSALATWSAKYIDSTQSEIMLRLIRVFTAELFNI